MSRLRSALQRHLKAREYQFPDLHPSELLPPCNHVALCPFDRIPPAMFWHMVVLYELLYEELLARSPHARRLSEDTLMDLMSSPATVQGVRENPLFELLLEVLPARAAAPNASSE